MGYIKLYNMYDIYYFVYYFDDDRYDLSFNSYLLMLNNDSNVDFSFVWNTWIFNVDYFETFMEKFKDYHIEVDNSNKDYELYASIGKSLKLKPFEYQREIVNFILETQNVLVVAPCGSGKTLIGVCAFQELLDRKMINNAGLIIVKASLKYQWKSEVEKFSDLKVNIIETPAFINKKLNSKIKRLENKLKKLEKTDKVKYKKVNQEIKDLKKQAKNDFLKQFDGYNIYILNFETLFNNKVKDNLKKINLDYIFVDEIHLIGNVTAKRSRAVSSLEAKVKVGATATPITKNPSNIYSIFKFIKPGLFPSANDFDNRFIVKNVFNAPIGLKNYKELYNIINHYMIRKTIEDIGKQLPELLVIPVYIDLDPLQDSMYEKITENIEQLKTQKEPLVTKKNSGLIDNKVKEKIEEEITKIDNNISGSYTAAQELCDSPKLLLNSNLGKKYYCDISYNYKLEKLFELIEMIIDSEEKVAIFSRYVRMLNIIADEVHKRYKNIDIAYVTGELSAEERFIEVYEKFEKIDSYKIILMSDAGCEGINLKHCKYLIEYDLALDYARQTQRHGRIQRADSVHKNVIVYQLIANNSYDIMQQGIVSHKHSYDIQAIQGKELEK